MKFRFPLAVVLCVLATFAGATAQGKTRTLVIKKPETSARLVDKYGKTSSEDLSARFDSLFNELSKEPASTGYVYLFCGKECRTGEIEAHMRGIEIKIALRNFDRSRLVVLNAGFRREFGAEIWIVPQGACIPVAESHLRIQDVEFVKSDRRFESYECCDDYSDVWRKLTRKH